ncbi:tetratricopeptide repeat protein [Occultella gossypii]|uniref:Tetratricopeptide repeat protein n=1 Tax=Occultella gossypii TaxID=2800820 RepID=A0ABS7SIV3_9MICO|nr:tetratricopeptide repeat protein [Occultella gossypii]MBZ2199720.1 tetratricopeptide repeat protein [Occultella gossypii]
MTPFDLDRPAADDAAADPVERNLDLAWELLSAQPTHPKIAQLALQVLAAQPERSSAALLLGSHREACGDADEARRLYRQVAGRADSQFINAARALRHLAFAEHDHPEALSWARTVLRVDQEGWDDWIELGYAQALSGEYDGGWHQLDEAVAMSARTAPDDLRKALGKRAVYLFGTFAPPEVFVPAAEEAIRADAANPTIALMLGWAYLVQYRFADAEELALRLLREDPTDGQLQNLVETARTMRRIVDDADAEDVTLEDIRRAGVIEMAWQLLRDRILGTDLASALAALDKVMPEDLRATLRPAATPSEEEAKDIGAMAAEDLVAWHDGQRPGSGATWGLPETFRLMSAAEMLAMDAAIEADPAAHPDWPQNDAREPVLTDDAGAYLVVVAFGKLVARRPGHPDEPVAESMADWIWDRAASFGGRDPRPAPRRADDPAGSLKPSPEVLAELDRLNEACRAAPGDMEPQIKLWTGVVRLDQWVCINRGTPEEPRPYALAAETGSMLAIFSSATRAKAAAHAGGLVPEGAPVPLFVVPLPAAIDWAMSFGERGVVGVTVDYPQLGAWCPLPNLARLKQMRDPS